MRRSTLAALAALVGAGPASAAAPVDPYSLLYEVVVVNSGTQAIESVAFDGFPMELEAPVLPGESITFDNPLWIFDLDFCVGDVTATFEDGSTVEAADLLLCLYSVRYSAMYNGVLHVSDESVSGSGLYN